MGYLVISLNRPAGPVLELRRQAETRLREGHTPQAAADAPPTAGLAQWTIHELEIHQIELELQGAELGRALWELEVLRATHPDPAGPGPGAAAGSGLSERERGVLRLVGQGLTSRRIAEVLGISPRTVESHRWRIMRKLDLANGAGLVRYALEHGLGGA
jgi:DNA-binding CsgD family transcriptional regulator